MEQGCEAGVWSRGVEQGCGTGVLYCMDVVQGYCTVHNAGCAAQSVISGRWPALFQRWIPPPQPTYCPPSPSPLQLTEDGIGFVLDGRQHCCSERVHGGPERGCEAPDVEDRQRAVLGLAVFGGNVGVRHCGADGELTACGAVLCDVQYNVMRGVVQSWDVVRQGGPIHSLCGT